MRLPTTLSWMISFCAINADSANCANCVIKSSEYDTASAEEGSRKATERPLYRIIHDEPNNEMMSFVLRETPMMHLLLWRNAYCQTIRMGRDKIVSLYPLLPNTMEVDRDASEKQTYTYTTSDGKRWLLDPRDVLHIPYFGFEGVIGYSSIALEKSAIGLGITTEEYGSKFFSNGARSSGVLIHPNTIKKPAELRAGWNVAYGSSSNISRVAYRGRVSIPPETIEKRQKQRKITFLRWKKKRNPRIF